MVVLLLRRAARRGHWCTWDGASATFSTPGNVLSSRTCFWPSPPWGAHTAERDHRGAEPPDQPRTVGPRPDPLGRRAPARHPLQIVADQRPPLDQLILIQLPRHPRTLPSTQIGPNVGR